MAGGGETKKPIGGNIMAHASTTRYANKCLIRCIYPSLRVASESRSKRVARTAVLPKSWTRRVFQRRKAPLRSTRTALMIQISRINARLQLRLFYMASGRSSVLFIPSYISQRPAFVHSIRLVLYFNCCLNLPIILSALDTHSLAGWGRVFLAVYKSYMSAT